MLHLYPGSLLTLQLQKIPMKNKSSIFINRNPLSGSLSDRVLLQDPGSIWCLIPNLTSWGNPPGGSDDSIGFSDCEKKNCSTSHLTIRLKHLLSIMDYGVECGISSTDVCGKITSCTQYHSIHYIKLHLSNQQVDLSTHIYLENVYPTTSCKLSLSPLYPLQ